METTELTLVTLDTAKQLGLIEEEFEGIKEILGRTPNFTASGVPFATIGAVTDSEITVDGTAFGNITEWRELYVNVLDTYLEN